MNKRKLVSVIIPTYNGLDLLIKCVSSLIQQTYKNFQIIVVDNGSSDKSREIITKTFPVVKFIEFKHNYGFAKACNAGIRRAKGDIVIILNNDAFPKPTWIEKLIEAEEKYPNISAFTSKIVTARNTRIIDSVGDEITVELKVKHRGEGEIDNGQYEKNEEVFLVPATAVAYRKKFFDDVGFFDEFFGSYFEDVDLSFRGQLLNHKYLYTHEAIVEHVGKSTSDKISYVRGFYEIRNSILVWIKNLPFSLLLKREIFGKLLCFYLILIFSRLTPGRIILFFKVLLNLILNLPIIYSKRKIIQKHKKATNSYLLNYLRYGRLD